MNKKPRLSISFIIGCMNQIGKRSFLDETRGLSPGLGPQPSATDQFGNNTRPPVVTKGEGGKLVLKGTLQSVIVEQGAF